jgi:hypothetical protein
VVAAGETRWLPAANHEVEAAIRDMRTTEVERAAEADALAEQLGMGSGLTLAALADAAPQPWDEILREHRVALSALAAEIDAATAEARQLLEAGGRGVREALEALDAGKLKPATGPHTEHATRLNRQA